VTSILRNKILAIYIGAAGLGVYSQIVNLYMLFNAIFPIGSIGITRYTSNYIANNKTNELDSLLKNIFLKNFVYSVILSLIFIALSGYISFWLFDNNEYNDLLIIFAFSVPASLFYNLTDAYFKGLRKINIYIVFLIINSIVNLSINISFIYLYGVLGAVLSFIITALLNSLVGFYLLKKENLLPRFNLSISHNVSEESKIYRIGLSSVLILAIQQITFLIVKSNIANELSLHDVGLFQSMYAISVSYFGIFFAILSTYSFPKISSLKNKNEIIAELNNTIRFLIVVYSPILIIVLVFRQFVIQLLFSNEFLIIKDILMFQLIGDFFRAYSWVFGLWLLPTLKVKQWMMFDILFYLLFYVFFTMGLYVFHWDLSSVAIAYMAAYFIHLFVNFLYTKKSLSFNFQKGNLKQIIYSSLVVLVIFVVSMNNEEVGFYIVIPCLLIWGYLTISKNDINNIKSLINSKIKS